MINRPLSIWSFLAVVALLVAAVFVVLGYGMILLPMAFVVGAVLLGAAAASFGSR